MAPRTLRLVYVLSAACAAALLLYVVSVIAGPTALGRVAQLQEAIQAEETRIRSLQERNQLMAAEIARLKDDPSQLERLARTHFGMIMPGEVFIQVQPR